MAAMTMIEAFEELFSLNEAGFETLVKNNAGEPQEIEYAIYDDGFIKSGESLYIVVKEANK